MTLKRGVVAAGDPQTAEAGAKLLRAGGNAIDAAVAAACASFVCELPLGSPLGGGVCVVDRPGDKARAFDMFARTPGLGMTGVPQKDFEGVEVSFGAATQTFHVGRASVAVPLALAGLIEIHRRFGNVPLIDVVAPAVALGRDGYVLGPGLAFVFEILTPIVSRTPECLALFTDPATSAIAHAGATLHNHDLARTLDDIARAPERLRDLTLLLAKEMGPDKGGLITDTDVDCAIVAEHTPVTTEHRGWQVATMPAPSTGGILVALGLRMLEGVGPFLSREHALLVARVQEALLSERCSDDFAARCADPAVVRAMLADERVEAARVIARKNLLGSTTHISVIDEDGASVALTLTNGEGCGHVLSGTGMIPNNLLGEQDLHPRGFHMDSPGSKLNTMMAPTLLSRGADRIALGSGGSNRLRTAILQVLVALTEHGLSPHDAVHAPRLHLELDDQKRPRIAFEAKGLEDLVVSALREAYPHAPAVFHAPNLYFGGVHLAMLKSGAFEGVGDGRRSGACIVVG